MNRALILRGDALALPLPDESVDLIVSSPPYFALRSYRDGDEHYTGQLGSEPTPPAFLEALWAVMHECWRVLKPTGSCFINLGDKRNSAASGQNGTGTTALTGGRHDRMAGRGRTSAFVRVKSKMLLPHRFAEGCMDGMASPCGCPELGGYRCPPGMHRADLSCVLHGKCRTPWIMRSDIVWQKLNCLSGGTQVYARIKGRPVPMKLHDLCRSYQPEDVQLWNGHQWTQVLGWEPTGRHPDALDSIKAIRAARRIGDEPVPAADLEIELRSGERIGCTREHRWPTQRGLIEAASLIVGDVIDAAPLPAGEVFPGMLDDEEVGWFVGLYIAEGSRSEGMIQIAGHAREVDRFKRLRDLASSLHATCNVYTNGNQGNVTMAGRFLDAILDTYVGGRTAKDKHLRPRAWERSNSFLRAVLDGYLSGDGSYDDRADRWKLGFTINDQWAADLRTMGARLGVSVRLRRGTVTGFDREWPAWLGSVTMNPARRRQPDTQVVAVRQSRARQFWDVAVADDPHLFSLASGVLSHNSLPESVTDRVRDSHEYLFHLTKEGRYFAAVDEVREGYAPGSKERIAAGFNARPEWDAARLSTGYESERQYEANSLGKLPGSVWPLPSEPLIISPEVKAHYDLPDHFAAFPTELVRKVILGWSPSKICIECGEGRRPVVAKSLDTTGHTNRRTGGKRDLAESAGNDRGFNGDGYPVARSSATITGYACRCTPHTDHPSSSSQRKPNQPHKQQATTWENPGGGLANNPRNGPWREYHLDGWAPPATRPAVVLDPFGGTGTTAGVARALGRTGVSVDLSHDYSRLADYLIHRSSRFAKVAQRTHRENQGELLI